VILLFIAEMALITPIYLFIQNLTQIAYNELLIFYVFAYASASASLSLPIQEIRIHTYLTWIDKIKYPVVAGMNDLLRREHLFSRQRNLTLILCAVLVSTALIWAGGFKYTLFGIPIIFIAAFVIIISIIAMMIDAERRL